MHQQGLGMRKGMYDLSTKELSFEPVEMQWIWPGFLAMIITDSFPGEDSVLQAAMPRIADPLWGLICKSPHHKLTSIPKQDSLD